MEYQQLNRDLLDAIHAGNLEQFIQNMKEVLHADPMNYTTWFFLARAYDVQGDLEHAAGCYAHLLQVSGLDERDTKRLLDETRGFVLRRKRHELVKIAEQRFGIGCLDFYPKAASPVRNETPVQARSSTFSHFEVKGAHAEKLVQKGTKQKAAKPKSKPVLPSAEEPTALPMLGLAISNPLVLEANKAIETTGTIQENQRRELLGQANKAFQQSDLETAYELLVQTHKLGDRSTPMFLMLAQTLQRLKRYDEAQVYLDEGARRSTGEQRLALLNLKAQIYSSQKKWSEAVDAYERLVAEEKRPAVRRFSRLQLARIYSLLGNARKAKAVLDQVLEDYPQDQVTLRMRAVLDQQGIARPSDTEPLEDSEIRELQVDMSDEGIDFISPMLRRDLAAAEFRDEKILRQGGHPQVEDADRVLEKAEKTRGSEFGERYPDFLEAAKAYNQLPEGSYYDVERFHRALTRYAMLKGGALVSELRRRIYSGQTNLTELSRLRDSASSYYLESLALQVRIDPRYALIPLTNLMRAQVAYTMLLIDEPVPQNLFQSSFAELFRFCHEHRSDELARAAYESVVALGSASGYVWNKLSRQKEGTAVLGAMLDLPAKRRRPYQILSHMIQQPINQEQKPGEVLKLAFLTRRAMARDIYNFFTSLQQLPLNVRNFRELSGKWNEFPHRGVLLDIDREVLDGMSAILATLLPYQTRSPEERTGILFAARTLVESLLGLIQSNPTYWGRVGFEPLLSRWQTAIRAMEQQRLSEIQPRLVARLEPPVFYSKGLHIEGGVILQNTGRGTAEGAVLRIQLSAYESGKVLREDEVSLREEISVNGTRYYSLQFPIDVLEQGVEAPYRIRVQIAPVFRQNMLDFEQQDFTLEVPTGTGFAVEDIPWDELKIPPEHLFKGRGQFINHLVAHLQSPERNKTYILYGLTRTGKSSILNYLSRWIDWQPVQISGNSFRFATFDWNIATARSQDDARDMWAYLLEEKVVNKLRLLASEGKLELDDIPPLRHPGNVRFRDWEHILDHLRRRCIYPVFLLDEFSHFRGLVDSKRIDASFLAAVRQFAIDGKASFIFAGTYDLQKLINDPAYGITGQLVNAIETKVSSIEREPAIELIQVMHPRLRFTQDAIEHILRLSYRIPYFIQLLCKNCAKYAVNSGRSILGFPEVEAVVQALTAETIDPRIGIPPMPAGVFGNNMQTPTDPVEYSSLISTVCHLTPDKLIPRMVTYSEIQATWDRYKVHFFQARLANAIKELLDREVLIEGEDEGVPAYQISVDLFRRWWANEHRNLILELDALKQEV